MRIEQGVKVYSIEDALSNNYAPPSNEIYICTGFILEGCYFLSKNRKNIISEPLSLETAIKIAKILNEDLKRGDV